MVDVVDLVAFDMYSNAGGTACEPVADPFDGVLQGRRFFAQILWGENGCVGRRCSASPPDERSCPAAGHIAPGRF